MQNSNIISSASDAIGTTELKRYQPQIINMMIHVCA
jgi:hypothetical protein